jgi:plasmid maintenance system antidote protein VapI
VGTSRKKPGGLVETLREAIRRSGRTHYELAQASGITPAQLDRFVAGERDLKLATAAKVTDALELELRPKGG